MVKLLSIISLILALVFFPPAVLAVISNNAIPGDSTYPIKRGLEDIIYAVASLNPNTKALFAKARSDRRFQEVTTLLTQGKDANNTLSELVTQTQAAADQINQVSDSNQKGKLISQLSDSITKYDQGLSQVSQPKPKPSPAVSNPVPDPELERTREELGQIKKRLAELEKQRLLELQNQQNQNQTQNATPTPTPTPTLTPTPSPTSKSKNKEKSQNRNQNSRQSNNAGKESTSSSQNKQEGD